MKKLILLIILTAMVSCGPSQEELDQRKLENKTISSKELKGNIPYGIYTIDIDSCKYIICRTGYGIAITHKQNCSNHESK